MRFLVVNKEIKEHKITLTPSQSGENIVYNPIKKDVSKCTGSIGFYILGCCGGDAVYVIVNGVRMTEEEIEHEYRQHVQFCEDCYVESHYTACEQHEEWGYASGCPYCEAGHEHHLCDEGKLLENAFSNFVDHI